VAPASLPVCGTPAENEHFRRFAADTGEDAGPTV
jgi:hypothetical protein